MSDRTSTAQNGPDPRAQALVGSYTRAGYVRIDPPMLQPAAPFLDLSGEDIRRRMFLTTDPKGREMCLRPDLTIPVSRAYLQSNAAGKPAGFCYIGPVFRHRQSASAESLQVGIESFGRQDKAAADAEMLALGLEATAQFRVSAAEIRTGDVGLFSAFVAALDLAPAWKRRLVKDFNRKSSLKHDLNQLTLAPTTRVCLRRSPAQIRKPRITWSPICFRLRGSPRSADAPSPRLPTVSSNKRRSTRRPGCQATAAH